MATRKPKEPATAGGVVSDQEREIAQAFAQEMGLIAPIEVPVEQVLTPQNDADVSEESVIFKTRYVRKLIKRQEMFLRMAHEEKAKHYRNTDSDRAIVARLDDGIEEDIEILRLLYALLYAN